MTNAMAFFFAVAEKAIKILSALTADVGFFTTWSVFAPFDVNVDITLHFQLW